MIGVPSVASGIAALAALHVFCATALYRDKYNTNPEHCRKMRLKVYSDAVFEKLQMHQQVTPVLPLLLPCASWTRPSPASH